MTRTAVGPRRWQKMDKNGKNYPPETEIEAEYTGFISLFQGIESAIMVYPVRNMARLKLQEVPPEQGIS